MHITTCTACGRLFEETSEETANAPVRLCETCYRAKSQSVALPRTGPIARYVRHCLEAEPLASWSVQDPVDIALTAAMLGLGYASSLPIESVEWMVSQAIDAERRDAAVMLRLQRTREERFADRLTASMSALVGEMLSRGLRGSVAP